MARKDIVVVGASAGGMGALEKLAAGLPQDFPAAMFVVWHLSPGIKRYRRHTGHAYSADAHSRSGRRRCAPSR